MNLHCSRHHEHFRDHRRSSTHPGCYHAAKEPDMDIIVDNTTPEIDAVSDSLVAGDTVEYGGSFVTIQTPCVGGGPAVGIDRKNAFAAVSIPSGQTVRRVSATSTFTDYSAPAAPAAAAPASA